METKACVTGASGFIGGRLARRLAARGVELTCLARSRSRLGHLEDLKMRVVEGDIRDAAAVAEAVRGQDLVFHLAAWFEIGAPKSAEPAMRDVNVRGTRMVLEQAWWHGVERIVYASTVGALGSSGPAARVGDEDQPHDGRFQSLYVRTKFEAHRVARDLIRQGAPIIIMMPEAAYGPGDTGIVARQMRLCLAGAMTSIPGVDGVYCYTHVDDIAEGFHLAAERGQLGREYILAGPPLTLAEFYRIVANAAGVAPPVGRIPPRLLRTLSWLVSTVPGAAKLAAGRPLSREAIAMIADANWSFSARRAERELGWSARGFEEAIDETIAWIRASGRPSGPRWRRLPSGMYHPQR